MPTSTTIASNCFLILGCSSRAGRGESENSQSRNGEMQTEARAGETKREEQICQNVRVNRDSLARTTQKTSQNLRPETQQSIVSQRYGENCVFVYAAAK